MGFVVNYQNLNKNRFNPLESLRVKEAMFKDSIEGLFIKIFPIKMQYP